MVREGKFIQQSVARAPTLKRLGAIVNRWSLGWFALATLLGAGYIFLTRDLLGPDASNWQWFFWSLVPIVAAPLLSGIAVLYVHDSQQVNEPVQRVFPVLFWARKLLAERAEARRLNLSVGEMKIRNQAARSQNPITK